MLESIRLRNLRSFSGDLEAPYIKLKPITVFVGKNSSGKSTCLRSFPLLRQSVEARTIGPILWYGTYVDFGAFSEAISHDADGDTIYFDFELELEGVNIQPTPRFMPYDYRRRYRVSHGKQDIKVKVELGVAETKNKTIAKSLKLKVDNFEYDFEFLNDSKCNLKIDGKLIKGIEPLTSVTLGQFLPGIGTMRKIDHTIDGEKSSHNVWDEFYLNEFFTKSLTDQLSRCFHRNTSEETIVHGLKRLGVFERGDLERVLKLVFKSSSSFKKNFNKLSEIEMDNIHALTIHKNLPLILELVDRNLTSTFKNIRYIAPLRATAERYYRHQDLQVDEIDHTGSNLAMLLKSWSNSENNRFSKWTMDNFGFKVRVNESGLHYALMVQTDGDEREYNINDMGFGFSQVLPIVVSIWLETKSSRIRGPRAYNSKQLIFTIEQPELHLHPEYQAKLATMFSNVVNLARTEGINLSIVFETHSKTMIDTLGDNIEDGIIDKDDINIVLFEKCKSTNSSLIRFSNYDCDGNLDNWPIGFFSGRY